MKGVNLIGTKLSKNRISHYFSLAENACCYSDNAITHVGAVLIYKNKVMSIGWNVQNKTHPIQREYNKLRGFNPDDSGVRNSLHAEMMCLLKAKDLDLDWNKCCLFVFRKKKTGIIGMARPCNACMGYIKSLGLKNIYYTTENGWAYECINQ